LGIPPARSFRATNSDDFSVVVVFVVAVRFFEVLFHALVYLMEHTIMKPPSDAVVALILLCVENRKSRKRRKEGRKE
jgi:hypothetical protein